MPKATNCRIRPCTHHSHSRPLLVNSTLCSLCFWSTYCVPDTGDINVKVVSYLKGLGIVLQGSQKWEQIRKQYKTTLLATTQAGSCTRKS